MFLLHHKICYIFVLTRFLLYLVSFTPFHFCDYSSSFTLTQLARHVEYDVTPARLGSLKQHSNTFNSTFELYD